MKIRYVALFAACTVLFTGCGSKINENAGASATPDAKATPAAAAATPAPAGDESWKPILDAYRTYATEQSDLFVKETEKFVKAVKSGNVEEAKKLYAPTRMYYERIEPIAEALGDLDPNIDARENDVEEKDWRGFHRIEQALWQKNTTKGQEEYADRLLNDAKQLRALIETVEVDSGLLVTGAVELLNEVSASKVTGEEERYSHTDLYDFVANVEGAKKIYTLLQPKLKSKDAALEETIGAKFKDLEQALADYKEGDGYVSYEKLKQDDTKKLSRLLDALAEPLSQMGTILGAAAK
ncbi:iron uptake system protein EfeO [Paenibacillus chitinolyticus]|uniref:iron uptake system protein EfeO n=1 Tax=Paenibacillus chitinolyticus TaxID=79263 RepID=UPI00386C30E1